jgi:hypothetical protein
MQLFRSRCSTTIVLAVLGLLAGCVTDSTPKKTAEDPLAKHARQLRAGASDGPVAGLSDRSRAIENDLGLH